MRGALPPLPQPAFMAWCSVKAQGQLYLFLYRTRSFCNTKVGSVSSTGNSLLYHYSNEGKEGIMGRKYITHIEDEKFVQNSSLKTTKDSAWNSGVD